MVPFHFCFSLIQAKSCVFEPLSSEEGTDKSSESPTGVIYHTRKKIHQDHNYNSESVPTEVSEVIKIPVSMLATNISQNKSNTFKALQGHGQPDVKALKQLCKSTSVRKEDEIINALREGCVDVQEVTRLIRLLTIYLDHLATSDACNKNHLNRPENLLEWSEVSQYTDDCEEPKDDVYNEEEKFDSEEDEKDVQSDEDVDKRCEAESEKVGEKLNEEECEDIGSMSEVRINEQIQPPREVLECRHDIAFSTKKNCKQQCASRRRKVTRPLKLKQYSLLDKEPESEVQPKRNQPDRKCRRVNTIIPSKSHKRKSASAEGNIDRPPKLKQWSLFDLKQAVEAVKEDNKSLSFASKKYGVPKSMLHSAVNGRTIIGKTSGKKFLTEDEEQQLAGWIVMMHKIGWGITKQDVMDTVKILVDEEGRKLRDNKDNKPRKDWWYGFLRRHAW